MRHCKCKANADWKMCVVYLVLIAPLLHLAEVHGAAAPAAVLRLRALAAVVLRAVVVHVGIVIAVDRVGSLEGDLKILTSV